MKEGAEEDVVMRGADLRFEAVTIRPANEDLADARKEYCALRRVALDIIQWCFRRFLFQLNEFKIK
jgi:hypothetical protein